MFTTFAIPPVPYAFNSGKPENMKTIFDSAVIATENTAMALEVQRAIDNKTKPPGSLGSLEKLAVQLGTVQSSAKPVCDPATLLLFAGDHGLTQEGISAYPSKVTGQMVMNFLSGGAAANVFARANGARVVVADAGVSSPLPKHPELVVAGIAKGTNNAAAEDAMSLDQTAAALDFGYDLAIEQCKNGSNTILLGEMGIGNTSSASLIAHALTHAPLEDLVGPGTGLDDSGLEHKLSVLRKAIKRRPDPLTPLETMAAFGGYEIAAMAGALIGAASQNRTVVVDGFIASAAALVSLKARPDAMRHCVFAHRSREPGHRAILDTLDAKPLLDLEMRLGEGTGALLALPLLRCACAMLSDMATFESANISGKE